MSRGRDHQGVRGPAVTGDRPGRRGGHPCQGIYHRPAGAQPDDGVHRDALQRRLLRALSRQLPGRARVRLPRLEHAVPRQRGALPARPRARGDRRRSPLAARAGRGRPGGAARQLRRRVADGRLPVAGRRAERHAGRRDAAARRHRGPAAGRPVRRARRALRPAGGADRLAGPVGDRRADPLSADPALDPFNPDNGPPYSEDFQRRYRAAQRARNERITDWALGQLDALAGTQGAGQAVHRAAQLGRPADDRPRDRAVDRKPNWCYLGEPVKANYGVFGVGTVSTLRTWLSMWSLRTSQCIAAPHLARITRAVARGARHADACVYDSDARRICRRARRRGQDARVRQGGSLPARAGRRRDQAADLIAAWTADHE